MRSETFLSQLFRLLAIASAVVITLWLLWGLLSTPDDPGPSVPVLTAVSFSSLPGWAEDDLGSALDVFKAYCPKLTNKTSGPFADPQIWQALCLKLTAYQGEARAFFEDHFQAWSIDQGSAGLFTGYYEPQLRGSRSAHGPYQTPIYRRPEDLVEWELKTFATDAGLDPELPMRRMAGRVKDGRLIPYFSRAEIGAGALAGKGLELLWVDDPVDAFFLQIQGSGRIELDTGETVRIGYDGQNGRPYRAIGRDLVARGALTPETVSMQSIRAWLSAHPSDATEVMNLNPSFVFFREYPDLTADQGPLGAAGLPLISGRSLAIDPRFWPYGLPVWLDTALPADRGPTTPYRRLMITGDTGGAIKGPVRGDIFFGSDDDAAALAGPMKAPGRLYILLPKEFKLDEAPFEVSKR